MSDKTDFFVDQHDMDDRIIPVAIEQEMKDAYIDYSMSVIVGRALPDVRDGLKPVHRRILFAMKELGMTHNRSYKKSARIVGEVLGKYHPHGDTAVYDAMVRMAQPWSMRYLLVEGQGNFGNQDGDGPAAMRYTESRLRKISELMMTDIEKGTVDFQNNFDDSLKEPAILPTRIPQLLINGSSGIAVGMATNILPHNLTEVMNACIAYVLNPQISTDDLMHIVKAPDFPTGGTIYGMEGVREAFKTGRGKVVLRGDATTEVMRSKKERIVIASVPYQVNRDQLCKKMGDLVNEKRIQGIEHVNNESNRKEGTRIVIDLKKNAPTQVILNQLYKHTELQVSFGVNNVALVDGKPQLLSLKDAIVSFIDFRHEVIVKRTRYDLDEAKKRSHILEGYLIALNNLDDVISTIRNSETPELAKQQLIDIFSMSEIQAKAVLDLRLQSLTKMRIDEIKAEREELQAKIAQLEELLTHRSLRNNLMVKEFEEVISQYGEKRRTGIQYDTGDIMIEDLIEDEQVVITVSHLGYIKRTSLRSYRSQKRGGRGMYGGRTRDGDWIEDMFVASTHGTLLIFTQLGRCYWLKVYDVPEGDKQAKGRPIQNMVQINPQDQVRTVVNVQRLEDEAYVRSHYIILSTKKGVINKTALEKFARPISSGVNAIQIRKGDQLLSVQLTDGNSEILLGVRSGRVVRFDESNVRPTGRGTIGVKGVLLDSANDEVVGMICENSDKPNYVLAISANGYGKRTLVDAYRKTSRGGKGVKTIQVTEKTGKLISITTAPQDNELLIICKSAVLIRMNVADISVQGRATQGVRLIKLEKSDSIAAVSSISIPDNNDISTDENTSVTNDSTEIKPNS